MAADDALFFIDANKYLDLYRTVRGRLLLASLSEQADQIFVTKQVVDEVRRQKIKVMADFLTSQFKKLALQTYTVPDHLFGTNEAQSKDILSKMKGIGDQIKQTNGEVNSLAISIMEKVSHSTDEVSTTLAPIFDKAALHSEPEIQRALTRKERGQPPGKKSDPVGDELSWEQILTRVTERTKLWLITRDSDYGTKYDGRLFLNQFLQEELRLISPGAEAFLFDDISDGIKHFASVTGVTADKLPTPEEIEEIRDEENSLPPLDWLDTASTNVSAMAAMSAHPVFRPHGPVFGWYPVDTVPSAGTAMLNVSSSAGTPSKIAS